MNTYNKPVPRGDDINGDFFEYCRKHELRFQQCNDCSTWRHMPRESCRGCGSFDWSWQPSSGRGEVFSWTVIHRALHPGFNNELPYAAVIVELEEGVRLVTQVVDIPVEALAVGQKVEVFFDDVTDEVTLPKFRRA